MKNILFILTLLFSFSCDYREYPEEQEYKEDIQQEMEEEKEKDPRDFDEERELELQDREVDAGDDVAT